MIREASKHNEADGRQVEHWMYTPQYVNINIHTKCR